MVFQALNIWLRWKDKKENVLFAETFLCPGILLTTTMLRDEFGEFFV